MTIDQVIEEYESSIDYAIDQFINDTKELEDEGLSVSEILLIIAAVDFTSYFVEELRFSTALNASNRVVFSSTCAVYGDAAQVPTSENSKIQH